MRNVLQRVPRLMLAVIAVVCASALLLLILGLTGRLVDAEAGNSREPPDVSIPSTVAPDFCDLQSNRNRPPCVTPRPGATFIPDRASDDDDDDDGSTIVVETERGSPPSTTAPRATTRPSPRPTTPRPTPTPTRARVVPELPKIPLPEQAGRATDNIKRMVPLP